MYKKNCIYAYIYAFFVEYVKLIHTILIRIINIYSDLIIYLLLFFFK